MKDLAFMFGIRVNLHKEEELEKKNCVREQEIKQDDAQVANMAVFAARTREATLSFLPEQVGKMITKRPANWRYYPPNWLTCEFCGRSFDKRQYVRLHKHRKHPELVGDNEVTCKFCPKYYTNSAMILHVRKKHPEEAKNLSPVKRIRKVRGTKRNRPPPPQCKVCKRYFTYRKSLKLHMQKKTPCIKVEKGFSETHNEKSPLIFKCWLCKKDFLNRQCLKRHILTHSSEKPHNCDSCGRGFIERANYLKHVCAAKQAQKLADYHIAHNKIIQIFNEKNINK